MVIRQNILIAQTSSWIQVIHRNHSMDIELMIFKGQGIMLLIQWAMSMFSNWSSLTEIHYWFNGLCICSPIGHPWWRYIIYWFNERFLYSPNCSSLMEIHIGNESWSPMVEMNIIESCMCNHSYHRQESRHIWQGLKLWESY